MNIRSMREMDLRKKKVLLRLDINSPVDPQTRRIVSDNRIRKSLPTLEYLKEQQAAVAIIAHQGDTLDYQNLIPLDEHAEMLSELLGSAVTYVDDVCGPAAQNVVRGLGPGDVALLGNLRYLSEEVSTFENNVPLAAGQMGACWLVRSLATLFDAYVNDAFAAAHRNAPSMVAFQRLLPSGAGDLFFNELKTLTGLMEEPARPALFVLGGSRISDAFGMMAEVLASGSADIIITGGITGIVFLLAAGYDCGEAQQAFLAERSLDLFIEPARDYLARYPGKIRYPLDLAFEADGARSEIALRGSGVLPGGGLQGSGVLPDSGVLFLDIGRETIEAYKAEVAAAGTIFVNGPMGVFEHTRWETGTREVWQAIAAADGFTVIGGGDSVSAAARFTKPSDINYICTAGGAMVRFLSGKRLPLIEAMEESAKGAL